MDKRDKKLRANLIYKINMFYIETEGRGDYRQEAKIVVDRLWSEYKNRLDAPLWLDRMIREAKSFNPANLSKSTPKLWQYLP